MTNMSILHSYTLQSSRWDVLRLQDEFPDMISHVKPYQALPSHFSYCLKVMKAGDGRGLEQGYGVIAVCSDVKFYFLICKDIWIWK